MSIKSSWEIALERTKDVEPDRDNIEANRLATEGKKLVSRFFDDAEIALAVELEAFDASQRPGVRTGVHDALAANLNLPVDELALRRNRRAAAGLAAIISDKRKLQMMTQQLEQFFAEYLQERNQVREGVDRQYQPRLQQKEEEMLRRTGRQVRIDPATDPEYVALLRQQLILLEDKYGTVLTQVKDEISEMFSRG
jgi:hypothetical protein